MTWTTKRQAALKHARGTEKSQFGHYSGKVIGVDPSKDTVDIRMDNGDTLRTVRVLFNSASTIAGWKYIASVVNTAPTASSRGTQDTAILSNVQDMKAIVVYLNGDYNQPRVIGFDFPINSQLHLNEQGLSICRHESGVYEIIDKNGHHETHYPDGSYVIVATDAQSRDLTAIQGNGQPWTIPQGATRRMTIHLAEGIDITSDGKGNLTVNSTASITLSAPTGKVDINGTKF